MEYGELMKALGESLGLDGFAPDANGRYRLRVDDTVVTFAELPGSGLMDIVAPVCELPAEGGDQICRILLSAMAPGGSAEAYSFYLAPDGRSICLRRTDVLLDLDANGLRRELDDLADVLDEWRGAIGDYRQVLPVIGEELAKQEDERRHLDENADGFLRV